MGSNTYDPAELSADEDERLLIASCIVYVQSNVTQQLRERLTVEDFRRADAGLYFRAICQVAERGEPTVASAIAKEVRRLGGKEVRFLGDVAEWVQGLESERFVRYHADEVIAASQRRRLHGAASKVAQEAMRTGASADEVMRAAMAAVSEVQRTFHAQPDIFSPEDFALMVIQRNAALDAGEDEPVLSTHLADLDHELNGGVRAGQLVVIGGRPGMGKCLGRGTPVLMYDGSTKPVEEIVTGDRLMGLYSEPRVVIGTNSGWGKLYRVAYSNGSGYIVNAAHILSLKRSKTEGKHCHGDILNIGVEDYLKKGPGFRARYKGYKTAVDFPEQPVNLDPYILGVWLGDGTSSKPCITSADQEVKDALRAWAEAHGGVYREKEPRGAAINCYVLNRTGHRGRDKSPLTVALESYNLVGNKQVPRAYLVNSRMVRLELLAGLLDTDGHLQKSGNIFEWVSKLGPMADSVAWLAESLGLIVSKKAIRKVCTNNGAVGTYWRVRISGEIWTIPTRIPRKRCAPFVLRENHRHRGIEVRPDGEGEYFGFELDGNGLFVLGDFTVTHNSALIRDMARAFCYQGRGHVFYVSNEMSAQDIANRDIAALSGVGLETVVKGNWTDNQRAEITRAESEIGYFPMTTYVDGALTSDRLRTRALEIHSRLGLCAVFVDYLQRMTDPGKSSLERVGHAVRACKSLAIELNVPVIIGSQLNRAGEAGVSKRPSLNELRESGEIEQESDIVILLFREGYYDARKGNDAEIIIAKQRQGVSGQTVRAAWLGSLATFRNLARG